MNHDVHNGRTLAGILADTREEIKQFLATRVALFRAELREKASMVKSAAPIAAVALVTLITAYLLFTLALVGVVLGLLPTNPFRWCFAFLAVALLWTIIGAIAARSAMKRLNAKALMPARTIGVLKEDGVWIQSEVKNQI